MKPIYYFVSILLIAVLAYSCVSEPDVDFNQDFLIGKWYRSSETGGFEYYRYDIDGNGATWDSGDDVAESEAQAFTWTLDLATLTLIHKGEMGSAIPKVYTIKTLNDDTLSYVDDYKVSYSFKKVK